MRGKAEIRAAMRARRRALTPEEKARTARIVCAKLRAWAVSTKGPVAVYLASPDEIDLTAFIAPLLRNKIPVVAPRWNGATYDLARLTALDPVALRRGPMGILEPAADAPVASADVAAWIVPGLAFTRDGRRLGYGGGWYDRFLSAANPNAPRLGVAYAFQVVDDLPTEPHDIRLTEIVDDREPIPSP